MVLMSRCVSRYILTVIICMGVVSGVIGLVVLVLHHHRCINHIDHPYSTDQASSKARSRRQYPLYPPALLRIWQGRKVNVKPVMGCKRHWFIRVDGSKLSTV